jgi:hypothetical protein
VKCTKIHETARDSTMIRPVIAACIKLKISNLLYFLKVTKVPHKTGLEGTQIRIRNQHPDQFQLRLHSDTGIPCINFVFTLKALS